VLVGVRVVIVLAVLLLQRRAALIEHTRKANKSAEAKVVTPGWSLRQVCVRDFWVHVVLWLN
jgi:hypothetical protein